MYSVLRPGAEAYWRRCVCPWLLRLARGPEMVCSPVTVVTLGVFFADNKSASTLLPRHPPSKPNVCISIPHLRTRGRQVKNTLSSLLSASIRVKLFGTLLAIGLLAMLITGLLGYRTAKDSLRDSVLQSLVHVRAAKAYQIENFFGTVTKETRLLGTTMIIAEASKAFRDAARKLDGPEPNPQYREAVLAYYQQQFIPKLQAKLGKDINAAEFQPMGALPYYLQYQYILRNPYPEGQKDLLDQADDKSDYSSVHNHFHPLLTRFRDTLGFRDLYLIDPETGRIIYTVSKETDLGTSLYRGPYRRSGLANVVSRCKRAAGPGEVCIEDFSSYTASAGAPTAFVASPVFSEGKIVAVLAVQISIDELNRVLTSNQDWESEGLGHTGETYVAGPDYLMRSDSRFMLEDPTAYLADLKQMGMPGEQIDRIRRYGTTILAQEVRSRAVQLALAGKLGTDELIDYRSHEIFAAYMPLKVAGVRWALVCKIDREEALAPVFELRRKLLLWAFITLLTILAAAAAISAGILRPVMELVQASRKVAQGDLNVTVPVRHNDELGLLAANFNDMTASIRDKTQKLVTTNKENEELLLNILPQPIANRLRGGEESIADSFTEVSVLFADLVNFTVLASQRSPEEIVDLLNGLFTLFDAAAHQFGIEKIKTIGDAYMAVCGLPHPYEDHASRMVQMAVRMMHITREFGMSRGVKLQLRIGINSGPVVAGVIGAHKFIYDLWGDTVNLASRMESHGVPDAIHITRGTYDRIDGQFDFESRGIIEVKGKGQLETFLLPV